MMKSVALPALLALALVCATVAAEGRGTGEIALFDGPRGAWLGALKDDAPFVVLEQRDGWRRVRLEGWIMGPGGGPAGTGGAAVPEKGLSAAQEPTAIASGEAGAVMIPAGPVPAAARPVAVQGVLAPSIGVGGLAGAGVLVLLVRDSGSLDAEHRKAGAECSARLEQKDRDIEALRAQANRALNSSDNFREATSRNEQVKTRLAGGQRERQDLIRECRARAQGIFETSVAQRALSDGSGRFEFPGVAPGRYRVVAFETAGESLRSWSFAFEVEGGGMRVLDPLADRSPIPADWGLR